MERGREREEILKKSMDSSRMVKGLESGSQTRKISRLFHYNGTVTFAN